MFTRCPCGKRAAHGSDLCPMCWMRDRVAADDVAGAYAVASRCSFPESTVRRMVRDRAEAALEASGPLDVVGTHECGGTIVRVAGPVTGYRCCKGCHANTLLHHPVEVAAERSESEAA